jgi:hypothetical protein
MKRGPLDSGVAPTYLIFKALKCKGLERTQQAGPIFIKDEGMQGRTLTAHSHQNLVS